MTRFRAPSSLSTSTSLVDRFDDAKRLGPVDAIAMARADQALRAVQDLQRQGAPRSRETARPACGPSPGRPCSGGGGLSPLPHPSHDRAGSSQHWPRRPSRRDPPRSQHVPDTPHREAERPGRDRSRAAGAQIRDPSQAERGAGTKVRWILPYAASSGLTRMKGQTYSGSVNSTLTR